MAYFIHVMCDTAYAATDVAPDVLTFLKANYLKYQVSVKLLNQVISKGFQASN